MYAGHPMNMHDLHDAAENRLRLIRDFVNTNDLSGDQDDLGTPERLRDWLAGRHLVDAATPLDTAAHARALAVREGIRALGRANNGEQLDEDTVASMNRAAAAVPLVLSVEPRAGHGAWALACQQSGVDGFLGSLLAAVAGSMADGSWSRLKACRSDTCRWLFYDRSRNRSGTWCSMAVCGSRMKARAYRARQRESATA
jgi:predicted RNA-binding Zn ribbon-like protein